MSAVLFEQAYRGDLWRLEVATHNGRTFGNWRKWYRDGETLRPTKQGVTFPVERLDELQSALAEYLAESPAA